MNYILALRIAAVGFVIVISGCVQVKYYPLCVFGKDPRYTSSQELGKKILEFVHVVVGRQAHTAISPNERLVAVETLPEKQRLLMEAWPYIACVGQTRYDKEYETYKSCVYLIKMALQQKGIPLLGRWSDGIRETDTVYCGHVLSND